MKVTIWSSYSFEKPYAEYHIMEDRIKALLAAGHDIALVQKNFQGGTKLPDSLQGNDHLHTVDIRFTQPQKQSLLKRYIYELLYYFRSSRKIERQTETVFIQSSFAAWFPVFLLRTRLCKSRIVYNVQDVFPYNAVYSGKLKTNSLAFRLFSSLQKYAYKHSDSIITISEDIKDLLVNEGTEENKIEVIYNWSYQNEPYHFTDYTPVSHIFDPQYFNVVYAGNIGVMQNVDLLIETAKLMKKDERFLFHIIGEGAYKDKLEKKAKEYQIENINFWPMQPANLAPTIYSAADVNIIPLAKNVYKTALPSKTATCLACGKPIIFAIGKTSKFGKRIMNETNCLVVDSDKPEELVQAIKSIHGDENRNLNDDFFRKYCNISRNCARYVQIIEG